MALKKRKTPLHVLFGEREALRNTPLSKPKVLPPNNKSKNENT